MLIDTHCHINMMVKKEFDVYLSEKNITQAKEIVVKAEENDVNLILNVGTSFVESINCLKLAKEIENIYAAIGIHPTDLTTDWKKELKELFKYLNEKEKNKIVAIGECGIDLYHPNYNLQRQKDAFKFQIETALENDLALVVHSRDASQETLKCLEEFKDQNLRGTIHCFSYDLDFAQEAINMGFVLGIDGPITYPKNEILRNVVKTVGLENIVLETDAPFLPPQIIRGKQNHPLHIKTIAKFIAKLLDTELKEVAQKTSLNAINLFKLPKEF